jgi:hypothetical protein
MKFSFPYAFIVLMNPEAVTCSWVGIPAGTVVEAAQEGISAGIAEVDMAQGTLGVGMAQDTLGMGPQEEAGRAACTAAVDKTSFFSSLRI